MKDDNKMIIAMAISGAVTGGILDYQSRTKPPEPAPIVETVKQVDQREQPKAPELKQQDKDTTAK
jgi:hypothetical protein